MRVRPDLDLVVNVAILATCGLVGTAVVQRLSAEPPAAAPPFEVGGRAESLPGVRYDSADATLVLYVRSSCTYCTSSMPFYQSLSRQADRADVRLVAVSAEDVDVSESYLRTHGVPVDQTVSFVGRPVPTPTLLLVDRRGSIRNVWVGQQKPEGEQQILSAIGAG